MPTKRTLNLFPFHTPFHKAPPALQAIATYAAQNPRLDFANYGDVSYYRSDARRAQSQLRDVRHAIETATLCGVIDADVFAAAPRAFSGRLALERRDDGRIAIDYCTGQYRPTEYRAACASVIREASRIAHARQAKGQA